MFSSIIKILLILLVQFITKRLLLASLLIFSVSLPCFINLAPSEHYLIGHTKIIILFLVSMRKLKNSTLGEQKYCTSCLNMAARNIAFSSPRFNNLMSLLVCNCNGHNSTDKFAFCDKGRVFGTADKSFILQNDN